MANWKEAQEAATKKVIQTQVNPTKTTFFAAKDFAKLCKQIERAYPDLEPDYSAVEAAGANALGGAAKLAVYKRSKTGDKKAANVTLYNGKAGPKAVWTNLEPVGA